MKIDSAKPRVLVVDDHPANRLAMEIMLENDFSVYLAESGSQALELAQRENFAVILLDIRMPILDGFETAAELRRRDRTRMTPIILTSAFDRMIAERTGSLGPGPVDFMLSPFDPDLVKAKVKAHAESHERLANMTSRIPSRASHR